MSCFTCASCSRTESVQGHQGRDPPWCHRWVSGSTHSWCRGDTDSWSTGVGGCLQTLEAAPAGWGPAGAPQEKLGRGGNKLPRQPCTDPQHSSGIISYFLLESTFLCITVFHLSV